MNYLRKVLSLIVVCCILIVACSVQSPSNQIEGIINSIEDSNISIGPLEQNPEEQYALKIVQFNQNTKINGAISSIEDLKVGDKVFITLEDGQKTDERIAIEIKVY